MSTSLPQLDPETARNLAITLGTMPRQIQPPGPQMAAPGPGPALPGSQPDLSVFPATAPNLKAPRGTLQGDINYRGEQLSKGAGEDQIYGRVLGSKLGEAHPMLGKILGGLGEGVAKLGDIGLSAVAPALAINLPGTEYHHAALVNQNNRQIGAEEQEATQETARQGEQAKTGLEGAQTDEVNARTQALENPPAPEDIKWKALLGGNGQTMTAPNGNIVQSDEHGNLRLQPLPQGASIAPKPTAGNAFSQWASDPAKYESFEKSIAEIKAQVAAEHPQQAKNASFMNIYAAQRFLQMAYTHNPALLEPASQMIGKLLNLSPEQTAEFAKVPVDQPLSPVTQQPIGTSMPSAPTGSTKTQAQVAARVLDVLPSIRTEVTRDAANLGPVSGRLAMGFLLGTVGSTGDPAEDQRLAELRTDLTFTGSGAAKFHLNSVRAMEIYDHLISAGKNTPEAINGTLDSVEKWAKSAKQQELGAGERGNPEQSDTREYQGHTYKKGADGQWHLQ